MNKTIKLLNHAKPLITTRKLSHCPKPNLKINVTLLGTWIPGGRTLALLLKQCHGINEIRLYGENDVVCSTAMDLSHIDTNTKVKAFQGDARLLEAALKGSQIIVICGGDPNRFTESQSSLFYNNVDAVRHCAIHIAEYNPKSIVVVATPPVNSLIPMISEEFKKAGVYDPRKIIGLSNLGSIIGSSYIGAHLKKNPTPILCPTIGGFCSQTIVPVLSQVTPKISLSNDAAEKLHAQIAMAQYEALERKYSENAGCLYLAMAFATCRFITTLMRGLRGEDNCIEVAYVRQTGHIEDFLPYMASIVKLGPNGVEETFMPRITDRECKALHKAHPLIKSAIELGQGLVTGEMVKCVDCRVCVPIDYCDTILSDHIETVGDVRVDLSKKYRKFHIYQ